MKARLEQLPMYYYTSFRTYSKRQGLIVIHEKNTEENPSVKDHFCTNDASSVSTLISEQT